MKDTSTEGGLRKRCLLFTAECAKNVTETDFHLPQIMICEANSKQPSSAGQVEYIYADEDLLHKFDWLFPKQ